MQNYAFWHRSGWMEETAENSPVGIARGNANVMAFWQDGWLGEGSFAILTHLTEFRCTNLEIFR
jgi:hypothetical protein